MVKRAAGKLHRVLLHHKEIREAVDTYASLHTVDDRKALRKDIARTEKAEGFKPFEYIAFGFYGKPTEQRRTYVSLKELVDVFNKGESNTLPRSKYQRYLLYREFFRRDVICISFDKSEEEQATFDSFISRHERFIAKPVNGTRGKGVIVLKATEVPDVDALYKKMKTPVLLEEMIQQGEELAQFHPASVNTIRLATSMNREGEFRVLFALFRVGRGASVTDNVGSGGLICMIDKETGVIVSDCFYEHTYSMPVHPDTGLVFKGTQIPQWEALLKIAEAAHRKTPDQLLLGWDFAWTTKCWDLVEVNPLP